MPLLIFADATVQDDMGMKRAPIGARIWNDFLGKWYHPTTKDFVLEAPADHVPLTPIPGVVLGPDGDRVSTYDWIVRAEVETPAELWGRAPVVVVVLHRLAWEGQAPGASGYLGFFSCQLSASFAPIGIMTGPGVFGFTT
jgi:hypothetical protein